MNENNNKFYMLVFKSSTSTNRATNKKSRSTARTGNVIGFVRSIDDAEKTIRDYYSKKNEQEIQRVNEIREARQNSNQYYYYPVNDPKTYDLGTIEIKSQEEVTANVTVTESKYVYVMQNREYRRVNDEVFDIKIKFILIELKFDVGYSNQFNYYRDEMWKSRPLLTLENIN